MTGGVKSLENVVGGEGGDIITGSGDDNVLIGNAGNDRIVTGAGDNIVFDGSGSDTIFGGVGNDTYFLTPGADTRKTYALDIEQVSHDADLGLSPIDLPVASDVKVPASDQVIDAQGDNTLDFSQSSIGVDLDMNRHNGQVQRIDPNDQSYLLALTGRFVHIYGSPFDDIIDGGVLDEDIRGRAGDDVLNGRNGDDVIRGDAGDDQLIGGRGYDTLDYRDEAAGVWVNLAAKSAIDGDGGVNTLRKIERVYGSDWNDTLIAARNGSALYGFAGKDTLIGGRGGDLLVGGLGVDFIRGNLGFDTAQWTIGDGDDDVDLNGDRNDVFVATLTDQNDTVKLESLKESSAGLSRLTVTVAEQQLSVAGVKVFQLDTGDGDDEVQVALPAERWCRVELNLGAGDDFVDATDAGMSVWVVGGLGDDTFAGGSGRDRFDGGSGMDTVTYADAPAQIRMIGRNVRVGRRDLDRVVDAEIIIGSPFDDIIKPGAGGHMILGGDGNDRLYGGSGDQTIYGGDGDDWLYGISGNNNLFGGDGNDRIMAGRGNDVLNGGLGDDALAGRRGKNLFEYELGSDAYILGRYDRLDYSASTTGVTVDLPACKVWIGSEVDTLRGNGIIIGSALGDTMIGGRGHDVFYGGDGNDTLQGGRGSDQLFGDAGNDNLDGGAGRDILDGGLGDDHLTPGGNQNKIVYHVGDGQDTRNNPASIRRQRNTLELWLNPSDKPLSLTTSDSTPDGLRLQNGILPSVELGTAWMVKLMGSDGNDQLVIGALPKAVRSVRVEMGDGDDLLDTVDSTSWVTAYGGAGNDTFIAGDGRERIDGGTGKDAISYEFASPGITGAIRGRLRDGAGSYDRLVDIESLTGTPGDDKLCGGGKESWIYGGDGDDRLIGRGWTNHLFGQNGNDTIIGGGKTSWMNGGLGNDVLYGRNRSTYWADYSDEITAIQATFTDPRFGKVNNSINGVGIDILKKVVALRGSEFNDVVIAGNRAMTIEGLGGDDTITGSTRADMFIWNTGDGNDTLLGGDGKDTVEFVDGTGDAKAWTLNAGAGVAVMHDGVHTTSFTGVEFVNLQAGDAADVVTVDGITDALGISRVNVDLAGGDDVLTATTSSTSIEANGGSGIDYLTGGQGRDMLYGGVGTDVIDGGPGNDSVFGGAGYDCFLLGDGSGDDRVIDTSSGGNSLAFIHSSSAVRIVLPNVEIAVSEETGETTLKSGGMQRQIYTENRDKVSLQGVFTDVLGSDHDDTIIGNNLANTLAGYGGSDEINGMTDSDSLHGDLPPDSIVSILWDVGIVVVLDHDFAGNDTIFGGSGDDTIYGDDGSDSIFGQQGDDVLVGGSVQTVEDDDMAKYDEFDGSDTIDAGPGHDVLVGGAAGDTLIAYKGINRIFGGYHSGDLSVTNTLETWFGNRSSTIYDGDDTIIAGGIGDMIFAGGGDDEIILSGLGIATVDGGIGNDTIIGVVDRGRGWYGDDSFNLQPKKSTQAVLWGSFGEDTFVVDNIFGIIDAGNGPTGIDIIGGECWIYPGSEPLRLGGSDGVPLDNDPTSVLFVGDPNTLD